MVEKRYVVVLGDSNHSQSRTLAQWLEEDGHHPVVLSLRDFFDNVRIDDSIRATGMQRAKVSWTLNTGQVITHANAAVVFNGLDQCQGDLERFEASDREYAAAEYAAYFAFALNAFPVCFNPPNQSWLVASSRSLIFQWELFRKYFSQDLIVPRYFYGKPARMPSKFLRHHNTLTSTNPFDVRHWKRDLAAICHDEPIVAFERPTGEAIVSVIIDGKRISYLPSTGEVRCSLGGLEEYVDSMAAFAAKYFGLRWFEILCFLRHKKPHIVFGSVFAQVDIPSHPRDVQQHIRRTVLELIPRDAPSPYTQ